MKQSLLTALLAAGTALTAAAFSGTGAGTVADPYQVTTAAQLNEVRNAPAACYKLMNDIDLAAYIQATDATNGWTPIANFSGQFNGDGKTISGLYVNRPSTVGVGLIGTAAAASKVYNLTLASPRVTGANATGTLAGNGYGSVFDVTVTGAQVNGNIAGGLIGYGGGMISGVDITGSTLGGGTLGGVVGQVRTPGTIIRYARVLRTTISGTGYVGGVVATNYVADLLVEHCILEAPLLSTTMTVGGVVGHTPTADYGGTLNENTLLCPTITSSSVAGGVLGTGSYYNITGNAIVGGAVKGVNYVGGLWGGSLNMTGASATVSGNYVSCNVLSTGNYVGGLMGTIGNTTTSGPIYRHTITDNRFDGRVATTGSYAGGIVGYEYNTQTTASQFNTVSRNVVTGSVSAAGYAAGILGYHNRNNDSGTATACYAIMAGNVCAADTVQSTGDANVKRIQIGDASTTYVGRNYALSTLKLLSKGAAVSTSADIYNGTAATATTLHQTGTYTALGYGTPWLLAAGALPRLAWQSDAPAISATVGPTVSGTAPAGTEVVWVMSGSTLVEATLKGSTWVATIDGLDDGDRVVAAAQQYGKRPSLAVSTTASLTDAYEVEVEHGMVITNMMEAEYGDPVIITLLPDPGYKIGTFKLTAGGKAVTRTQLNEFTYSFTMPASNVNLSITFVAEDAYERGDVNGDGEVSVDDLNTLVNVLLGVSDEADYDGRADVNDDTHTDVRDLNELINAILD